MLQAFPNTTNTTSGSYTLKGNIVAARVHDLQQQLPDLTSGEGLLEHTFSRYEPARTARVQDVQ